MKKETLLLVIALIIFFLSFIFNTREESIKASFVDNFQNNHETTEREFLNNENITCILKSNNYGDWKIFTNETHDNFGCKKVEQTREYIKVFYEKPFLKITGASVTGDDNIINKQIIVGSSIGTKALKIKFYKNGKLMIPREVRGIYTNIYIVVWGFH